MARVPSVTRTLMSTKLHCTGVNLESDNVESRIILIPVKICDKTKAIRYIEKNHICDDFKIFRIDDLENEKCKLSVTLDQFINIAKNI